MKFPVCIGKAEAARQALGQEAAGVMLSAALGTSVNSCWFVDCDLSAPFSAGPRSHLRSM